MMKIIVNIIARNESSRHLKQTLECARAIATHTGGQVAYTDDASEDNSVHVALRYGAQVQTTSEPMFWINESVARNRALDFSYTFCEQGDWVLSLDADETINRPDLVLETVKRATHAGCMSVALPLYEFWSPTHYRTDGYWFGGRSRRLFRWVPGSAIASRDMACGSEPTWVPLAPTFDDHPLRLLHWGYVRPEDRPVKHLRYTTRLGGHGHSSNHVNSIITEPTLAEYVEVSDPTNIT